MKEIDRKSPEAELEMRAYAAAMQAFCQALADTFKGERASLLLGTVHEHVAVLTLGDSTGMKVNVRIEIEADPLAASVTAGLALLQKQKGST